MGATYVDTIERGGGQHAGLSGFLCVCVFFSHVLDRRGRVQRNSEVRDSSMLGSCSWSWLGRCSLPCSLVVVIFTWCLVPTVGSFGQESAAGVAPSAHDGGNRPSASWDSTGGQETDENEAYVHGGYEELLANIPERDLPAYRALGRGLELYVRGSDTVLLAAGQPTS